MAKQIWMPEEGDRIKREDDSIETIGVIIDYTDDSWTVQLDDEAGEGEEVSVVEYDEVNHFWKEDV